jgi:hypothetical protein
MKAWVKALCSETFYAWWTILSAVSTISTFFIPSWSGKVSPLFAISSVVAFGWANYRVFEKKESRILELQQSIALHEARVSELVIVPEPDSRYYVSSDRGIYLQFDLMIENKGRRNSVITNYQVEIVELKVVATGLRPADNLEMVRTRHCTFAIDKSRFLAKTGNIQVSSEQTTNRGSLMFHLPDVEFKQFSEAGLNAAASNGRFGQLHCRLTLFDTTKNSASHEFVLTES